MKNYTIIFMSLWMPFALLRGMAHEQAMQDIDIKKEAVCVQINELFVQGQTFVKEIVGKTVDPDNYWADYAKYIYKKRQLNRSCTSWKDFLCAAFTADPEMHTKSYSDILDNIKLLIYFVAECGYIPESFSSFFEHCNAFKADEEKLKLAEDVLPHIKYSINNIIDSIPPRKKDPVDETWEDEPSSTVCAVPPVIPRLSRGSLGIMPQVGEKRPREVVELPDPTLFAQWVSALSPSAQKVFEERLNSIVSRDPKRIHKDGWDESNQ